MVSGESSDKIPPGVSIVIPAYNYARYLPLAIDSLLKQEYSHYEIIVVDDGSTDSTAEVAAKYGDRIRYIYQKNAGLPAARNTGIQNARFGFIGFLDADDEWLPGMLKRTMETFAKLSADFAVVACHTIVVDEKGNKPKKKNELALAQSREITCRDIILKTRFAPSTVVARRSAFDACGLFDTTLRSSEDRDMWIRIAAQKRVYQIEDRLVLFRTHSSNMSRHADRMKDNSLKVISKSFQNRLVPRFDFCFWLRVLSFCYFQTAWMYRGEGRRKDALRDMFVSIFLWPCFFKPRELNEPILFRLRSLFFFSREKRKSA